GAAMGPLRAGGRGVSVTAARRGTAGASAAFGTRLAVRGPARLLAGLPFRLAFPLALGLAFGTPFALAFRAPLALTLGAAFGTGFPLGLTVRLPFRLAVALRAAVAVTFATRTAVSTAITAACRTFAKVALRATLRFQAFDFTHRDTAPDEMLDTTHLVAFGMNSQRVRLTVAARAAGAADAVNVVFRLHGQVVAERVADALHVDAAGGNVGGYPDPQLAALQPAERTAALAVLHGAVPTGRRVPSCGQVARQVVGAPRGGGEHSSVIQGGAAQQVIQQAQLVGAVVSVEERLHD